VCLYLLPVLCLCALSDPRLAVSQVSGAAVTVYNSTDCTTTERPIIATFDPVAACTVWPDVGSFSFVCDEANKNATVAVFTSADCGVASSDVEVASAYSLDGECSGPLYTDYSFTATGCGSDDSSSSSGDSSSGATGESSSSSSTGDNPGAAAGLTSSALLVAGLAALARVAL